MCVMRSRNCVPYTTLRTNSRPTGFPVAKAGIGARRLVCRGPRRSCTSARSSPPKKSPAEAGLRCSAFAAQRSCPLQQTPVELVGISQKVSRFVMNQSSGPRPTPPQAWPPCSIAALPQARTCRSGSRTTYLTIACTSRCGVPPAPESISLTEQAKPSCRPGPDCPTKKAPRRKRGFS